MVAVLVTIFLCVPVIPTLLVLAAARKNSKLIPVRVRSTRRDTTGTDRGSASK